MQSEHPKGQNKFRVRHSDGTKKEIEGTGDVEAGAAPSSGF